VGQLFVEMQERRQQMAIVVDEYGGTAGIVTLELLLEEMVGPVTDELGRPEQEFRAIDERTVQVDGGMHVDEVREQLQIPIPEGDYDTVAGYVLNALGHIPQEGETVAGEGFHVTVTKMDGRKIEQVVIRRTEDTSAPASEDAEEAGTGR
jgi:putative hemolysin